jgi:hypothetical protein
MHRTIRTVSLSLLLAAAFSAGAQTPAQMAGGSSGNPMARGERSSFFFNGMKGSLNASQPQGGNALKRPTAQFGPVTPVPEPSEWAMLLVGLTFVGWIVRRKTKQ